MNAAHAGLSVFARIGEKHDPSLLSGGVERVELTAQFRGRLIPGSIEQDVVDLLAQVGREDGFNLAQSTIGGLGELRAAPGFHHAGPED